MRCLHYFIFFLLSSSLAAKDRGLYKIDHLEPPFWWAGMIDSSLQLMVHGQNISDLDPVLDHKGVRISGVHRTKNPNYLFIDLVIKKTLENASSSKIKI